MRPHAAASRRPRRARRGRSRLRTALGGLLVAGLWLVAAPAAAHATTVELKLAGPNRIAQFDEVRLEVTLSGSYDSLQEPTSDGFDFERVGRRTSMNIIGRRMERSESLIYVGRPRRAGTWTIGPVRALADGKVVATSGTLQVQVIDGRQALGKPISVADAADFSTYRGERVFVRPVVGAERPFVGQPFVAGWELYWHRRMRVSAMREIAAPDVDELESEDLLAGKPTEPERVNLPPGVPFQRQLTRQLLLTAARPGKRLLVGPQYKVETYDVFDNRAERVAPRVVQLDVRPVPTAGRPDGFDAASVGRFNLRASLDGGDRDGDLVVLAPGQRAVLTLSFAGSGNLLGLVMPRLPDVDGMRAKPLNPQGEEDVKATPQGLEGRRSWAFIVRFDKPGRYTIPAWTWASFDPFEERFVEHPVGPFEVEVRGQADPTPSAAAGAKPDDAPADPAAEPAPAAERSDGAPRTLAEHAETALRPIAPVAGFARERGGHWTRHPALWGALLLPWLLLLGAGLRQIGGQRRARGAGQRARSAALPAARSALQTASSDAGDAYASMRGAVAGYLQAAAGLRLPGLTWRELRAALAEHGAPSEAIDALVTQLEHCDFARFAPQDDAAADARNTADALTDALEALDPHLKPPPGDATAARSAPTAGKALQWLAAAALGATLAASPTAKAATLEASFEAANQLLLDGDAEGAQRAYERMLAHRISTPALHYNLAHACVALDRLGEAVAHLRTAQRLGPEPQLAADIEHDLGVVRARLAERARKKHRVLHIFDESPEAHVALGRAAPQGVLGALAGLLALLAAFAILSGRLPRLLVPALLGLQLVAFGWLQLAHHVEDEVRYAVIVEPDRKLRPCVGTGEPLRLPEGLEVRLIRARPDGRPEVRLPNGRQGCLPRGTVMSVDTGGA